MKYSGPLFAYTPPVEGRPSAGGGVEGLDLQHPPLSKVMSPDLRQGGGVSEKSGPEYFILLYEIQILGFFGGPGDREPRVFFRPASWSYSKGGGADCLKTHFGHILDHTVIRKSGREKKIGLSTPPPGEGRPSAGGSVEGHDLQQGGECRRSWSGSIGPVAVFLNPWGVRVVAMH